MPQPRHWDTQIASPCGIYVGFAWGLHQGFTLGPHGLAHGGPLWPIQIPRKSHRGLGRLVVAHSGPFPQSTVGIVLLTSPWANSGLAQVRPMWDLNGLTRARANPMGPLWPTEIPGGIWTGSLSGQDQSKNHLTKIGGYNPEIWILNIAQNRGYSCFQIWILDIASWNVNIRILCYQKIGYWEALLHVPLINRAPFSQFGIMGLQGKNLGLWDYAQFEIGITESALKLGLWISN